MLSLDIVIHATKNFLPIFDAIHAKFCNKFDY